jgi:O-antigen ligase
MTFLVCLVPIASVLLYGAVDTGTLSVLAALSALMVTIWVWDSLKREVFAIDAELLLPLAAIGSLGLVQLLPLRPSYITDELPNVAAAASISLDPYATRFFLIRLLLYIVFFAAALAFIGTRVRLRAVVVTVIVFGSLIAFYSILQRVENPSAIYGMRAPPQAIPFGTYVNRHHFAALMEMTLGLTLGLLFGGGANRIRLPFLGAAAAVMGIAIALTGSRGAILSLLALFAVVIGITVIGRRHGSATSTRRIRPAFSLAATLAGSVILITLIFGLALMTGGGEFVSRGFGLDPVPGDLSSGRLQYWNVALQIFRDHPLIGAGLDAFGVAYTRYDPSGGAFRVEQAHNDYLQMLADGGIVGMLIAVVFIVLLVKRSLNVIGSTRDTFRRSAAIGAFAGCVAVLVHSFFDFPLRTPANAFFFLLLAAIATVSVINDGRADPGRGVDSRSTSR